MNGDRFNEADIRVFKNKKKLFCGGTFSRLSYATNMVAGNRIYVKTSLLRAAGMNVPKAARSQAAEGGKMCPRFQSNAFQMKRTSVACIFHSLSIISSEMG